MAIITAIGAAHYERFKTLETVAKAKFELAEATLPRHGKIIIAEDVLQHSAPQVFAREHPESVVVVRLEAVRQNSSGVETDVRWRDALHTLRAPLFGEHQALNIALAFVAACELGIAPEQAAIALASVPQVSHRLEVKRQPGGWVTIDDAYNSNPVGFASGLRALDLFREDGGRRILVTPGMVELGSAHDAEHKKIGDLAASCVDVLLPVLPNRIPTLLSAYHSGNPRGTVVPCLNHSDAQAWLNANLRPHDAVLVENDLPDLYENRLSL
jgi:UDP-N-acetylmuramoyl-tripeptide--D-alanyl-D-alanine ligase